MNSNLDIERGDASRPTQAVKTFSFEPIMFEDKPQEFELGQGQCVTLKRFGYAVPGLPFSEDDLDNHPFIATGVPVTVPRSISGQSLIEHDFEQTTFYGELRAQWGSEHWVQKALAGLRETWHHGKKGKIRVLLILTTAFLPLFYLSAVIGASITGLPFTHILMFCLICGSIFEFFELQKIKSSSALTFSGKKRSTLVLAFVVLSIIFFACGILIALEFSLDRASSIKGISVSDASHHRDFKYYHFTDGDYLPSQSAIILRSISADQGIPIYYYLIPVVPDLSQYSPGSNQKINLFVTNQSGYLSEIEAQNAAKNIVQTGFQRDASAVTNAQANLQDLLSTACSTTHLFACGSQPLILDESIPGFSDPLNQAVAIVAVSAFLYLMFLGLLLARGFCNPEPEYVGGLSRTRSISSNFSVMV